MMKKLFLLTAVVMTALTGAAQGVVSIDSLDYAHFYEDTYRDNWYYGGGVTGVYSHGNNAGKANFFKMLGPGVSIFGGKRISPYNELRLSASYFRASGAAIASGSTDVNNYGWNVVNLGLDYRPSLVNIFSGYRQTRNWDLHAVIGAGVNFAFGYPSKSWNQIPGKELFSTKNRWTPDLRLGLSFTHRLNEHLSLGVDAIEHFTGNEFDGYYDSGNRWDKNLSLMVSVQYHPLNSDYYTRRHRNVGYNVGQFKEAQALLEEMEVMNDSLDNNRPHKEYHATRKIYKMYMFISFDPEDTTIHELQNTHVYNLCRGYEMTKGKGHVCIVDANGEGGDLFEARVKSIIDAVQPESVNKFEDMLPKELKAYGMKPIGAEHITYYKSEDEIPFKEMPSHVIILFVNE